MIEPVWLTGDFPQKKKMQWTELMDKFQINTM
jgi:hypothetical protein